MNAAAVDRPSAPTGLRVAAGLAVLEGVALLVYAVLELLNLASHRLAMGLTTAAFFAVFGGGLILCARAIVLGQSWARAPIVGAQLIILGTAWSFRGGETTWVWLLLSAVALGVIVGILMPSSRAALSPGPD